MTITVPLGYSTLYRTLVDGTEVASTELVFLFILHILMLEHPNRSRNEFGQFEMLRRCMVLRLNSTVGVR